MRKTSPATASKTQGPQPATSVAHSAAGAVRSCAARREHADGKTRSREADHRGPAARQTSPGHALMSYTQLLPASGPPASASSFPRTLGGIPRRVQSYSPHKASGRLDCGIPVLWGANLYWATMLFHVAGFSWNPSTVLAWHVLCGKQLVVRGLMKENVEIHDSAS